MIKKVVVLLALLIVPVLASAQKQDTLLAPDGTLFTISRELSRDHPDVQTQSESYLMLTARRATGTDTQIVPATLLPGAHQTPAMAYDADTKTLFVFWFCRNTTMTSELLFASVDANGVWSEPTSLGGPFSYRSNLRIAVTRKVTESDGSIAHAPAISVHAVWWEYDMHEAAESARYTMFVIENGRVVETNDLDLATFVDRDAAPSEVVDEEVLKQPVLFTSPKQDSVLVMFGDMTSKRITEVRIHPSKPVQGDGRLRVPVGRHEGGFAAPVLTSAANSRMDGIYGDENHMAFYTHADDRIDYVIMNDGQWSEQRAIALDSQLSEGAVVDALRRLLSEN